MIEYWVLKPAGSLDSEGYQLSGQELELLRIFLTGEAEGEEVAKLDEIDEIADKLSRYILARNT